MTKKIKRNYTFRVMKNGEIVSKLSTHSIRRFLNHLRTISWQDKGISVYLRVYYGKEKDVFGETVSFYNDGVYKTKRDLWHAFIAFKNIGYKNA